MRVKGVKDIMVGEVYEYEPWFRDGRIEFMGIYLLRAGHIWVGFMRG